MIFYYNEENKTSFQSNDKLFIMHTYIVIMKITHGTWKIIQLRKNERQQKPSTQDNINVQKIIIVLT